MTKYRIGFYAQEEIIEADTPEEAEEKYFDIHNELIEDVDYCILYRKRKGEKRK